MVNHHHLLECLNCFVDYYEEIIDDHRAFYSNLRECTNSIRLQLNKVYYEIIRDIISETHINNFWNLWIPDGLQNANRKIKYAGWKGNSGCSYIKGNGSITNKV